MDLEVFLWAYGLALAPLIWFGFYMVNIAKAIKRDTLETIESSGGQNERLDKIARAIKDQVYYLRILAEQQTGKKLLPPLHDTE